MSMELSSEEHVAGGCTLNHAMKSAVSILYIAKNFGLSEIRCNLFRPEAWQQNRYIKTSFICLLPLCSVNRTDGRLILISQDRAIDMLLNGLVILSYGEENMPLKHIFLPCVVKSLIKSSH